MTSSSQFGGIAMGPAVVASAVAGVCEAAGELALYEGENDLAAIARLCARSIRNSLVWEEMDVDTPPYCVDAEIPYFALRASHRIIAIALDQIDRNKWGAGPLSHFPVARDVLDEYFTTGLATIVDMLDMSGDWRSPNLTALEYPHDCTATIPHDGARTFDPIDLYGAIGVDVMEALDAVQSFLNGDEGTGMREAS